MGIKDVFNQAPTPEEEALYKQVLDEVESGVMRKGIYAKALADGLGDEGKAQSLYIKYRVQSLVDEQRSKAKLLGIEIAAEEKERKKNELRERDIQVDREWKQKPRGERLKLNFYIIVIMLVFLVPIAILINELTFWLTGTYIF